MSYTQSDITLVRVPDHADRLIASLPSQFRDSHRLVSLLRGCAAGIQEAEDLIWRLYADRLLPYAEAAQLDQWGALVGEERGGLDDVDYRRFVLGRLQAERSHGTTDELTVLFAALTAPSIVRARELYPYALELYAYCDDRLSDVVARRIRRMMDIAKAMASSLELVEVNPGYLGFDGDPDAEPVGYGQLSRSF